MHGIGSEDTETGCPFTKMIPRRGGGLAAIEGDRYILTLMGILGDRPPTTREGFRLFEDF